MIHARLQKPYIVISGDTYDYRRQLGALPAARWEQRGACWLLPATPSAALDLRTLYRKAALDDEDDHLHPNAPIPPARMSDEVEALARQAEIDSAALEMYRNFENLESVSGVRYQHQLGSFGAFRSASRGLLYQGLGSGKTRTVIDMIDDGRNLAKLFGSAWRTEQELGQYPARLVLVICKKNVIATVWPRELSVLGVDSSVLCLTPDRITQDPSWTCGVTIANGTASKKSEALDRWIKEDHPGIRIVSVNYETVWRKPLSDVIMRLPWDMVIADEIQNIKSPGGKASRFMSRLADVVPRRFGMSGTPTPHSPLDAYGFFRFLDKGVFGTSNARFKARYALFQNPNNPHHCTGFQNEEEFREKFYSITYRVHSEEVLDLPPFHHVVREFDLPPKAQRVYNELRDEYIAYLDDEGDYLEIVGGVAGRRQVVAQNALVAMTKLAEVACGHVIRSASGSSIYDSCEVLVAGELACENFRLVGSVTEEVHSARRDLLEEVFEEIETEEPIIVFYRFKYDRTEILKACGKVGRAAHDLKDGADALAQWQQAEGGEVFVAQIQSGSEGIDLTRAKYCIYYSHGYSLGHYLQSLARPHRPGQTRPVTYIHLEARGTIDRRIRMSHDSKKQIIDEILVDPRYLL